MTFFSPQDLLPTLARLPAHKGYWIAYSGGLDSHVLLHALVQVREQLGGPLQAVHVHHGLSPNAEHWVEHCRAVCEALAVPLRIERVELDIDNGESLEAQAREARYRVFTELLGEGELLLTAHHQDDQVETMLLQLLRGGGPRGLAAMPLYRSLGRGWLARPLLEAPRRALRHYAERSWLNWEDDESNDELRFERNFLRHQVLPLLQRQWPALGKVMGRSAGHFAEAAQLLDELAEQDRARAEAPEAGALALAALEGLGRARRKNLLRYWLRRQGLSMPDTRHLERILDEVVGAREDAAPLVSWHGGEVRRYHAALYAMAPLGPLPHQELAWQGERPLYLPHGLGELHGEPRVGEGIKAALAGKLRVRFRRGGEQCRLCGREHHHSLKKLFQEQGIPPWRRDRTPLIAIDGQLAQIGNLCLCEPFAAAEGEPGLLIFWKPGENNG